MKIIAFTTQTPGRGPTLYVLTVSETHKLSLIASIMFTYEDQPNGENLLTPKIEGTKVSFAGIPEVTIDTSDEEAPKFECTDDDFTSFSLLNSRVILYPKGFKVYGELYLYGNTGLMENTQEPSFAMHIAIPEVVNFLKEFNQ